MRLCLLLPIVYSWKISCHNCLWIRNRFPSNHHCSYFDKPILIDQVNCTSHKLKNIDW